MEKILSIVWYKILPPVFGGQKGIAHFNEHLSRHYPLVCLCSENNEPANNLSWQIISTLPVSKWQFLNPFCWKKIKSVVKKEKITHIILEHPYHAIAAFRAKKAGRARLIIHSHNIESERFRQTGKWWWKLLRHYEKWIHQKADLSLFKTEKDRNYAIQQFKVDSDRCIIVPYGISKQHIPDHHTVRRLIRERHAIALEQKILLFAGTLDHEPNAKAVELIYREIAPALSAANFPCRIIICGRNRFPSFQYLKHLSHPAVFYAGEVPDIENYFSAADIFINPARCSSGVQTKNIDALSYHCNLVCFDEGLEKETIQVAGEKIFSTPAGNLEIFIQQIMKAALRRPETPAVFFQHYEWGNIITKVAEHIAAL